MNVTASRDESDRLPLPAGLEVEWDRLSQLNDDDLERELVFAAEASAKNFVRLAMILRQKEERGHDTSSLRIGLIQYLRKIAYCQMLPEVLSKFGVYPQLLRRIAALPLPEQRVAVEGDIEVAVVGEGGSFTAIRKPAQLFRRSDMQQVFAADHLRSPEEQVAWLRSNRTTSLPSPERPPYTISSGGLEIIRPCRLTKRDVQNILKALER